MALHGGYYLLLLTVAACHTVYCSTAYTEDVVEGIPNTEELMSRLRRSAILREERHRWDKGIVPFILTWSLSKANIHEIKRAMATYERYTCIRFTPWTSATNADYGLGHDGHLNFVNENSCNADLGNKRSRKGQHISCCDEEHCIHELGHALGFIHEHQSPARKAWIRMNEDNLRDDWKTWYRSYSDKEVITDGFDVQSIMAYPPSANTKHGDSYTILDADLTWGENFFYLFKQIAKEYKCAETKECSGFTKTCANDGFVTVVEGKCACYCPKGLDPATGCETIMKVAPVTKFPGGQYALPMPLSGCPDDSFTVGYWKHFTDTDGSNKKSSSYNLKGFINDNYAEHYFCVHNGTGSAGTEPLWSEGGYCTYQVGGKCPEARTGGLQGEDFQTGDITVYDKKTRSQRDRTGALPDGTFSKSKTEFEYCCRDTGFPYLPMYLPNTKPVAVFLPEYNFQCQEIFGMHSTLEYVGLNSLNYREATYHGSTPHMKTDRRLRRLYMKHCYYEPANTDCGAMIKLDKTSPSVSFSSSKGDHIDCHWHVSVPKGHQIKLDLKEMNVRGEMPNCEDYVSVRHVMMGQVGKKYCGTKSLPSIISYNNSMMIHFVTFRNSPSSFKATLSLVSNDDLCYSSADKGLSYAGKVSHTKTFKACVPWEAATSCPHHAFNTGDNDKGLVGSHCRNPDVSRGPWCYTDVTHCARDYCDVCNIGSLIDTIDDCKQFKASGQCNSYPQSFSKCAKTCKDLIANDILTTVPARTVTCSSPSPLPDGIPTESVKKSYKVGETVNYKCNAEGSASSVTKTCLTTGEWSPAAFACMMCEPGWTEYGGHCYKYDNTISSHRDAKDACAQSSAYLASAKDSNTNAFLHSLSQGGDIWLGATNPMDSDVWSWADGEPLSWTNWKPGYPELTMFPEQCLLIRPDQKWMDTHCMFAKKFICEKVPGGESICADFIDTCEQLLTARPDMCTSFKDFSARSCARSCKMCQPKTDCEVVAPTTNVVFVDKSFYTKQTVPQGTQILYSCLPNAKPKSGDATRTCQAGQLLGSELICVKECSIRVPTANAELVPVSSELASVLEGAEVHYKCKKDTTQKSGDTVRTCEKGGQLSGSDLVCEIKKETPKLCKLPGVRFPLKQMKPSRAKTLKIGGRVWYWCYRPYIVTRGSRYRYCQSDGTLSGSHPSCGRYRRRG